jgi:hypothetical protein
MLIFFLFEIFLLHNIIQIYCTGICLFIVPYLIYYLPTNCIFLTDYCYYFSNDMARNDERHNLNELQPTGNYMNQLFFKIY